MVRFMLVTFGLLAWAFYVMSGGAEFDPDRARFEGASIDPLKQSDQASTPRNEDIEVTRVSLDLTSVEDVIKGPDETPPPAAAPQQRAEPAMLEQPDDERIEIIPSLIENATPEPAAGVDTGTALETAAIDSAPDFRVVTGSRVNVRGGPGTSYGVVGKLVQGDRVEVLDESGTGWVRMRPAGGGTVGWLAEFLLSDG